MTRLEQSRRKQNLLVRTCELIQPKVDVPARAGRARTRFNTDLNIITCAEGRETRYMEQLIPALIALGIAVIGMFALIAGGIGLYFRSTMSTSAQAYKYVLEDAKITRELVNKQSEDIALLRETKASDRKEIEMLSAQLLESRQHSRERDEALGGLKVRLEQATIDRDAMAKRVTDLEAIRDQRHEENTQRDIQLKEIDVARLSAEKERDSAREALRVANEYVAKLEAEIVTLKKEVAEPRPALALPPIEPAPPVPASTDNPSTVVDAPTEATV